VKPVAHPVEIGEDVLERLDRVGRRRARRGRAQRIERHPRSRHERAELGQRERHRQHVGPDGLDVHQGETIVVPGERVKRDDSGMPRLDVVGVIVSDLDRAIDFYRRLGLEFPDDPDPQGHGHVEAALPGGLRFTLDTEASIQSFDAAWSPPSGGHRTAIAFRCESPEAVDRLHRELADVGAGSHKEPWDAFWGQRYAQVKDPDGSVVDLFAPLQD
jgi:catechol 2,3-dioxygenase-like lactoylglutathione lyase family enzyme